MPDKTKKVVLLGFMYSGKTTVGKKLAKKLGYKFYDTDAEIEYKYHYSINSIFKTFGEEIFRNMEKQMLEELLQKDNVVISCGGGTPCFFDNMQKIKDNSISIYLFLTPGQIFSRYKIAKVRRPLLEEKTEQQAFEYIDKTLAEREQYYNQADITLNAMNLSHDEIVEKLLEFNLSDNM